MLKTKPHILFIIGLLLTLLISTAFHFTIPKFEYFSGDYSVYKPGDTLPDTMTNDQTVSNVSLLWKFTKYGITYWAVFIVLYFFVEKVEKVKIKPVFTHTHFILTIFGFSLLTYLNQFIINPHSNPSYLSDIFVGEKITKEQTLAMYQLILWYDSLRIQSSIIGILLCLLGLLIFIIGIIRGWKTDAKTT